MLKKLFVLGCLFLGLFSMHAGAQDSSSNLEEPIFPDVEVDSPYFTAIENLYNSGVIQGYDDGTFRPNQKANRAEALKIILLSSDIEIESSETNAEIFPDVKTTDWYYPYIKKAEEIEIIQGYEDGFFRPSQIQNIAETLKIILLTNNVEINNITIDESIYPDVTNELWYAPYALYAEQKNIITPQDDGTLSAGRGISRGELAEIMYRLQIVIENNGTPFDITMNWAEFEYPAHAFKAKKPFNWKIINNESSIVFWRQDTINQQSSYELTYPYSASVIFHLDKNEQAIPKQEYIENLENVYKSNFETYQKNSLQISGYDTVEFNVGPTHDNYYMFIPSDQVLHIYTAHGTSDLSEYLLQEIDGIVRNTSYIPPSDDQTDTEEFLSTIRNRILVEGIGQETLDMFDDLVNIETDTIGVGTGPVDYYYSATYDITLKYERDSDTILDMQNGRTSAF